MKMFSRAYGNENELDTNIHENENNIANVYRWNEIAFEFKLNIM